MITNLSLILLINIIIIKDTIGNVCGTRPAKGSKNPLDWNRFDGKEKAKSVSDDGKVLISGDKDIFGEFNLIDNNIEDITVNIDTSGSKKTKEEAPIVFSVWVYDRRNVKANNEISNEGY